MKPLWQRRKPSLTSSARLKLHSHNLWTDISIRRSANWRRSKEKQWRCPSRNPRSRKRSQDAERNPRSKEFKKHQIRESYYSSRVPIPGPIGPVVGIVPRSEGRIDSPYESLNCLNH